MEIPFTKMHGCGNDYIYIDCVTNDFILDEIPALAMRLSDRHFGIGGDGIILIMPSQLADARMRMFNSDGSEAQMCGNGIRCVARYLYDNGIVPERPLRIETLGGVRELFPMPDGAVRVDMGQPELRPEHIPVLLPGASVVNRPLTVGGAYYRLTCVSMGNPHCVVFVENTNALDLPALGPGFEHHPVFPERVNTEFAEIVGQNAIKIRVWERGTGETLACGTGACAAATAAVLNGYCAGPDIRVSLSGGELTVNYSAERVYMTGPCETVFRGTVHI